MVLLIQCLVLCTLFTFAILPAQYKNPLSQVMLYPTAIRKRVLIIKAQLVKEF